MVNYFFIVLIAAAQEALRDWMRRIANYPCYSAILDIAQHAATVRTILRANGFNNFLHHTGSYLRDFAAILLLGQEHTISFDLFARVS